MSPTQKSPAMPLFGKDAYTDEQFNAVEWDVQGLFWRLAFWQWMEGSIPADIEKVINMIGKPKSTRRLWPEMAQFFVPVPDKPGRLYNLTTEQRRKEMLDRRQRHQFGADLTNAKRTVEKTLSVPHEDDGERDASRIATATAIATATGSPEEGAGGGPAPILAELSASRRGVALVLEAFAPDMRPLPGRVAGWISELGSADAVLEIVQNYPDKPADYIAKVVTTKARKQVRDDNGSGPRTNRKPRVQLGKFKSVGPSDADIAEARRTFGPVSELHPEKARE